MTTTTNTNPGTVDVSRQAYPPAPSRSATPSSNALNTSNGENQFPASRLARVAAGSPTAGHGLPLEVHPASTSCVRPTAAATAVATAVHGLPTEIHPASCVRPIPAAVADTTSPARDVRADSSRPGGLPVNVNIR